MMGGFNQYVDLFKTYQIEYVIILVFLVAIIFFWRYLSKRPKAKKTPSKKKRARR
jgi:uncharacterized membrane protein